MKFHLLDPLRGLAALGVLGHHLRSQAGFSQLPSMIETLFRHGNWGVPIFFIISGFCIMNSLNASVSKNEKPFSFLLRRAKRIYIPFWFSIIVAVLIPFLVQFIQSIYTGAYISPYDVTKYYHKYLSYSLIDWVQVFSLTKIFEPWQGMSGLYSKFEGINGAYWSLAIEMQFYVVMFLSLWFKNKRNTILVSVTVLSWLVCRVFPELKISGLFFYYWHYFAAGIVIYSLFSRGIKPSSYPQYKKAFQIGCWGVLCACLTILVTPNFYHNRGVFIGLFTVFIWLIEVFEVRYISSLSKKNSISLCLSGLGAISYSVYLVHTKLILVFSVFFNRIISGFDIWVLVLIILFTLIGSYGFYLVCEKPFHKSKNTAKIRADATSVS